MRYKQLISQATQALKSHTATCQPHTIGVWEAIQFKAHNSQVIAADAQASCDHRSIYLYPSLLAQPADVARRAVLCEFGLCLLAKSNDAGRTRWEQKLDVPSIGQIDSVQDRLQSPDYIDYLALVQSFPRAVDRLVAINICNALTAGNVSRDSARSLDIRKCGSTLEYCARRRYHSLVPLAYAYAPRSMMDCFGSSFAGLVLTGLGDVRENSTQKALTGLIDGLLDRIR